MTRFLINNGISIQKAGIPSFPGFIEHTTVVGPNKNSQNTKSAALHVIWLDLENAYGSVRH